MPRLGFGPLLPDQPSLVNQRGLTTARNMLPQAGGYESIRGLSAISGATVLTERPRGSISGIDGSGSGFRYTGTGTKLWVQRDAGDTDISRAAGYALGSVGNPDEGTDRWSLAKFGNRVFASSITTELQQHKIGTPGLFADVPRYAPRARHIATIGNFLMAGNIYDAVKGTLPEAVSWSAIDNGLLWPKLDSDDAVSVQSDWQPLEGGGGWVQDVVGGAEIGVVFQERAIHRFDYRGGDAIFEKNRVVQGNGMFIPYSGVAFERMVFYIAEDGFRIFDYTGSVPIGQDQISKTFLADLDDQYRDRVETGKDPDRTLIWVIYPGQGNVGGRPNKAIFWDYSRKRFSQAELELEGLIVDSSDTAASIDAPASAGDPDDVDDPSGEFSFDDRPQAFGNSRMGAYDSTFLASDFTGDPLEGLIETGDFEGAPGRMFWLDHVRPLVSSRKAQIAVATRDLLDDDVVFGPWVSPDADGTVPFRGDARYHRFRIKLPAGWNDAVGIDIEGSVSGTR